jgi:microcystin-dependent protein
LTRAGAFDGTEGLSETETMSDPFLGEIRPVGFNFAPSGWAACNGQTLPISQNTALFSLLGTNFGGNGSSTFALPNLQGSVALGMGQGAGLSNYPIGVSIGAATVTLDVGQLATHNHTAIADGGRSPATSNTPVGNAWGKAAAGDMPYSNATPTVVLSAESTVSAGGSEAHNNLMSYLTINFIIALQGIYPQRS